MLEEKSVPYTLAALPFGGHRTPEYRAIHPFGRIPAMDHGDFRLYETQAMLRYLDRIAPNPVLIPTDPIREARMNQINDISACISFFRLFAPRLGIPVDEARIADALPRAQICVDVVSGLLGEQTFMAGDSLSLADLMIVPHAHLMAWLDRMHARHSMEKTTVERLRGG